MPPNDLGVRFVEASYQFCVGLAWPVVVALAAFGFRKPLVELLASLTKLKLGGTEFGFDRKLHDAEQKTDELGLQTAGPFEFTIMVPGRESPFERAYRLSEVHPRSAIIEAYRSVQFAVEDLARASGADTRSSSAMTFLEELVSKGKLERLAPPVFGALRELRNEATHARTLDLEPHQAEAYVQMAESFVRALAKVRDDSTSQNDVEGRP